MLPNLVENEVENFDICHLVKYVVYRPSMYRFQIDME